MKYIIYVCSCEGLNENGPYRPVYLNAWVQLWKHLERLKRYGLLDEVCHREALRFKEPRPGSVSLFLLPVDQDVKLSATAPAAACLLPEVVMNYVSKTVSQPPIKCFGHGVSS